MNKSMGFILKAFSFLIVFSFNFLGICWHRNAYTYKILVYNLDP